MALRAEHMRQLAALNLAPNQMSGVLSLIADIQADEEAREALREETKARDRERKRVQRNSVECPRDMENAPYTESLDLRDSEGRELEIQHAREPKRGTRIADAFRPSQRVLADPQIENLTRQEIENQIIRMIDWAKSAPGQKGVKTDWDRFASNWLRRVSDEKRHREQRNKTNGTNQKPTMAESFQGAVDLLDAKRRGRGEGDRSGGGNILKLPGLG